ncbi:hypothetical protein NLI96_g11892 [Meripilus lineatus]|uniref:L-serine ammonia-lyase n=1 Tax=Meripilus lineatus TaxID=2056292 RepID=A0AAD5YCZ4_9APHY|nr:hypothetical protein NLI96_g11892 [Physisporinus lineatus]
MKCTVFLPHGATPAILRFFEREGAEVRFEGTCYPEAFKAAQLEATTNPNAVLIPAYDDPVIWEGYSSMVREIARQLPDAVKPDTLFCSVGGGGLAGGIMVGCKNVGWDDVPLVTMETTGSNCFYQSVLLNRKLQTGARALPPHVEIVDDPQNGVRLALLKKLTSRASSLGASMPSAGVVKMALERPGGVKCACGPDELAMQTTLSFADDHKMLVELACSTTLIPAYNLALFEKLVPAKADGSRRTVVFVVCGGFKIDFDELVEYNSIVKKEVENGVNTWETHVDGELVEIPKLGCPYS